MSHTPGPWKVVDDEFNEPWKKDVCTDPEGVMIANVRVAPPVGETEANALLIAAAPSMLKALQYYRDTAISSHPEEFVGGEEAVEFERLVNFALKEAEGHS